MKPPKNIWLREANTAVDDLNSFWFNKKHFKSDIKYTLYSQSDKKLIEEIVKQVFLQGKPSYAVLNNIEFILRKYKRIK
jgi:hypothetical protein